MPQLITRFSLFFYSIVCLLSFAWWSPNFFAVNVHFVPHWDVYFVAASGVPFGLLVLSILALQSILEKFSFALLLEFIIGALLVWCISRSFYYPPQASFFCPILIYFCAAMVLVNLFFYQRQKRQLKAAGKA